MTPWTVTHQAPLVLRILQARRLEWVALPLSKGSFLTRGSHLHLRCWQVGSLPLAPTGKPSVFIIQCVLYFCTSCLGLGTFRVLIRQWPRTGEHSSRTEGELWCCPYSGFYNNIYLWLCRILVATCRLSCPAACGILAPGPGIEPVSLALEGGFLTRAPPGTSLFCFLKPLWFPGASLASTVALDVS